MGSLGICDVEWGFWLLTYKSDLRNVLFSFVWTVFLFFETNIRNLAYLEVILLEELEITGKNW